MKSVDQNVNQYVDPDDLNKNNSDNVSLNQILEQQISRRSMMKTIGTASLALFGASALTACSDDDDNSSTSTTTPAKLLSFTPVAKSIADVVSVPAGYTASVVVALGDPLSSTAADFKNDGTDTNWEHRSGDHHDGMEFFGVNSAGTYDPSATNRGVLATNHEATTNEDGKRPSFFIHANGGTDALPRPASEVDKELAIHGLSFVEVKKNNNKWAYVKGSSLNGRVTQNTEVELSGPLAGTNWVKTKYATDGKKTRGTLNNCGANKTPWGTYLSGEENWAGYFYRDASDDTTDVNRHFGLVRYGRGVGSATRHGWETAGTADTYTRWDITVKGTNPTEDFRNEINCFGYMVEADPINRTKKVKKRTAMGRFAHEMACFSIPKAGRRLAVYQGDDSRNEYFYKFVTDAVWSTADANSVDPLTTGDNYLNKGKLYVAKFNANGTGEWIELSINNALIQEYNKDGFKFSTQEEVLLYTRLAADAVGATKMDRPEWSTVHPQTGEVYLTLTNNSKRTLDKIDAANPRYYEDVHANKTDPQKGNVNGHIVRLKEGVGQSEATSFTWDIYLFGAESGADKANVNISELTADQDFSSPDGLWFSPYSNLLWIQTDDGALTDQTNCMMLAAIPGSVGDGNIKSVNGVTTYVGEKPTASTLKRFLVGPKDCEITGVTETPDGKALFINIQHPGENTFMADVTDSTKYTSQWPSNAGYGAGKRPRSATIVITKNDGGVIGS